MPVGLSGILCVFCISFLTRTSLALSVCCVFCVLFFWFFACFLLVVWVRLLLTEKLTSKELVKETSFTVYFLGHRVRRLWIVLTEVVPRGPADWSTHCAGKLESWSNQHVAILGHRCRRFYESNCYRSVMHLSLCTDTCIVFRSFYVLNHQCDTGFLFGICASLLLYSYL